jgi:hypothetical protein
MFKKYVLLIFIFLNFLQADYSLSNLSFDKPKKLIYDNEMSIEYAHNEIEIKSKQDLRWLIDSNIPKKYDSIETEVVTKTAFEEEKKEVIKLSNINFAYLIKNTIEDHYFYLQGLNQIFKIKTSKSNVSFKASFPSIKRVTKYEYQIDSIYKEQGKDAKIKEREILVKYVDDKDQLIGLELLNNGVARIKKAIDENVISFENELESREVTLKKFDFSKDTVYLAYVSNYKNSQKRMNISYGMEKNHIKTITKSPISFLDPENKTSNVEENIGFLKDINGKELFQVKHVQLVNSLSVSSWLNKPDKAVVVIEYLNGGEKDNKMLSKSIGQQFYSFEGLLYFVSWMSMNNIKSDVITYINGIEPIDITVKNTKPKYFEMLKSGKVVWTFETNDIGFVTKISFPAYNLVAILESADSDITIANRKYLENLQTKFSIIKVD